ncbi:hypothetical protein OROMI_001826 [Orobanche minor]
MNSDWKRSNQIGVRLGLSNFWMEQERLRHQELVQHQIKYATENGIQIIQPHIQQSQDDCSFAAVSKQLDYQLRLIYARAEVPTTLPLPPNGCLINHLKWQQELMDLTQRHVINDTASYAPVPGSYVDAHTIKRLLGFFPLVGVIAVKEDFSNDGKEIYEGKMKGVPDDYIKSDGGRDKKKQLMQLSSWIHMTSIINNQVEAKVALSSALLNVQEARELLKDLGRCQKVYENVSAAAQIPISETAKKVNDVHISREEIQLHCLKLEKELNRWQLLMDTSY